MTSPAQVVADNIQGYIEDIEKRLVDAVEIRPALEAQLRQQRKQLAYVKKVGGLK